MVIFVVVLNLPIPPVIMVVRPLVFILVSLAWLSPVRATTVVPPAFPELVNESDCIVWATVAMVETEPPGPDRSVFSKVTLEVKEVIKGQPPTPLVLRVIGGKIGKEELVLVGAPKFMVGQEGIFFIQGNGRQIYPLTGMMYGLYPIEREAGTNRESVMRSNRVPLQHTVEVAEPMGTKETVPIERKARSGISPTDFVRQIKAAIKPDSKQAQP